MDSALVPSLEALEDMDQTLASSLVHINNWIAEQSRADEEKKGHAPEVGQLGVSRNI